MKAKQTSKKPFRQVPAVVGGISAAKDRAITDAVIRGLIAKLRAKTKKTNGKGKGPVMTAEEFEKILRAKLQTARTLRKSNLVKSKSIASNTK